MNVASGGDLQSAIDAHGSGTTFCLSGTYHPSALSPKDNDTFVGPAVLDGQGSAKNAFDSSADGVTINGLEVRNYASSQQYGAVQFDGSRWTVENSYIHDNAAAGVFWNGDSNHVINNRLMDNGEEGFSASDDTNTLFQGNEVGNNNTSHQDWNFEAGGGKFFKSRNLTVRGNYVHDNDGPGLWCDTNCTNVLIENNAVRNNAGPGIDYEISTSPATIRNNTLSGNATDHSSSPYWVGGGIWIDNSQGVQVYGNVSTGDGNGIILLAEGRGSYTLSNNYVHDNLVKNPKNYASGLFNDTSDTSYWSSRGNRFQHDGYQAAAGARCFSWSGSSLSWSGWQGAHQDTTGSYGS